MKNDGSVVNFNEYKYVDFNQVKNVNGDKDANGNDIINILDSYIDNDGTINALDSDSDNDGLADYMENTGYSIQIIKYQDSNIKEGDTPDFLTKEDRSAYTEEYNVNSDPWNPDTDGDGVKYGIEYQSIT